MVATPVLAAPFVAVADVVERLRGMPAITELRSAVIWTKKVSAYTPDYYCEMLETSPWIHQPFEEYDGMEWIAEKHRTWR